MIKESVEHSSYDEMMLLNEKVNKEKRAIISTLEHIAYKEWEIDSVTLFVSKYPLMDSVLLKRLHDIEFEFGYSDLLERIEGFKKTYPETENVPRPENWSGWILKPTMIEFWLEGPNRIHERLRYYKELNNWIKKLLNP